MSFTPPGSSTALRVLTPPSPVGLSTVTNVTVLVQPEVWATDVRLVRAPPLLQAFTFLPGVAFTPRIDRVTPSQG
jgi:hypothetical protein